KPQGFVFAPHPAVTDTDRDKYAVHRIVAFYQNHRIDYADYFLAAWQFQHREALGKPTASLNDFAVDARLSAKYLGTIWSLLRESPPTLGTLGELQAQWKKLPDDVRKPAEVRRECERLRNLVDRLRKTFPARVDRMTAKGISEGSQPFVLWRNDQLAALHRK